MGADRTINSIVLLSNGISFAIQVVLFLILGAYADFGTLRSKILIGLSVIAYAIGFGWLGVHTPDKWQIGTGLYIVGKDNPIRNLVNAIAIAGLITILQRESCI